MKRLLVLSLFAGFGLALAAAGCTQSTPDAKKDGNVIAKDTKTNAPPPPPPIPPPPKDKK